MPASYLIATYLKWW